MRLRATLMTLVGVSWLASAAIVPRLDIISESSCSSSAVHEASSAPSKTSCSTTALGNVTTATLTNPALPDTVSGQVTSSVTRLSPIPKPTTVTVPPNDPSSASFTASVLPVSGSANSSSLGWIASGLTSDSSSCTLGASHSTDESNRDSSAPRAVTLSLGLDSTVTVTVPKPVHTEATSVLTVTYPDGPGHTATLLVTVTIPEFSLGSGTAIAPAATPTSTNEDVTVTMYVSPTSSTETHLTWSASSSELTSNTLDSEPTTTVTVYYNPTSQATGSASQPLSLYLPYELTYTLSPGTFLPTPFTGTITITPSSPLPSTATASLAEMDTGRPVPLAAVSTAGELGVLSSSATLAATAVTMTYTAFISGSTTITTVTEYPSLISGTPVVTVLTPSPISNTVGSVPMIPLTITLTSEVSTISVSPQTATSPAVGTGGLDAEPVTVTVTSSEPSNPSIGGAVPYGSNVDSSPDTTTALSLATSTLVSPLIIMTITVPEANSEDSTSSMQTTWDSSAVITVTESARESRATPSSPVPFTNTPSGTSSASVIRVTYTVPGLSGSGPSSYVVTYTVHPSGTASLEHESAPVTPSSSPGTAQTPDISSAKSSFITSPSGTEPTVTITYTVSSSVSSSSTIDPSPTETRSANPVFSTPQTSGYGAAVSSESTPPVVVTVTKQSTTSSKGVSSSSLSMTLSSSSGGGTTSSDAGLPTDSGQYQYHTTGAVLPTSASDQFTVAPTTDVTLPISTSIAVSTVILTLTQTVPMGYGSSSDNVPLPSATTPSHGAHNTTTASSQSSGEVTLWPAPTSSVSAVDPIFTSAPSSSTELDSPWPSTTSHSSSDLEPTPAPITHNTSTNTPIGLSTCTSTPELGSVSVTRTATPLFSVTTLKPSQTSSASSGAGQSSACNGSFSGASVISTISISLIAESGITLGLASPPQTEFHHHAHAVTDNSISTLTSTVGGYGFSEPDNGYENPSSGYGVPVQTTSSSSPTGLAFSTDTNSPTSASSAPLPYGATSTSGSGSYGFDPTTMSSVPVVTGPGTAASTTTIPVPVVTYPSPASNSTSTSILLSTATSSPSYSLTNPPPTPTNFTTSTAPESPINVTYTLPSTLTSAPVTGTVSTTAPVVSSTAVDPTTVTIPPSASSSVANGSRTRTASTSFISTANTTAITSIPIVGTSVSVGINTTTPGFPTVSFSSTTGFATNPFPGTTMLSTVVATATIIPAVPPFPNITTPTRTSGASPTNLNNTTSAPTSFANTMTNVVPVSSGNHSTSISATGVYNYTTTAFHNNTTVAVTPTQSAPFGNQTAPVSSPFLNNTASVFTRSLMSTLTPRILTSSTAHATLISTPTVSAVSKLTPRSLDLPIACGMGGDRGAFVLEFDDIPRFVVEHEASPYHRFVISNGFRVAVSRASKYEPFSGHQLLQHDSSSAAQIGVSHLRNNACFRFDFHGIRLGCDSVHGSCVFQLTGLKWNGVEDVIQGHTLFTIPACSDSFDCTLSHQVLDSLTGPSFTNLTAINITLAAPSDTPTWWMDDLQIAWTDNRCVTAACRARVPNTVVTPEARGSLAETASRFLRWAVRG